RRERRDELSRSCRVPSERSVLPRSVGHAEDRRAERVGRDLGKPSVGVAGVIAAIIDNGQDVAGTAQVKVMALRALGLNGQGSSFNTSQAIRWAAQNGAKIINLSLGTNETFGGPTDIQLAIDYAW